MTPLQVEALLEHSGWIRALARQLVRDPATADDVLQKTWVAALERDSLPAGDHRSLRRWLAAVLRNFARQARRSESRRSLHEERAARPASGPSTLDVVARASVQREVVAAVLALDEPYRTTILLRFFDGLPPRGIARRTGAPVETVRTRLARGIARLRDRLDEGRGGDRAAWLGALVPFLRPSSLSTTLAGATLVNAKTPIAAALVLGGALTVYLAARPTDVETPVLASPASSTSRTTPDPDAATTRGSPTIEAPLAPAVGARAPAPVEAAEAASPEPAAGARLRGRVLDDHGSPVSGVRVALVDGGRDARSGQPTRSGTDGAFEMPFPKGGGRLVCDDERYATVLAGVAGGAPGGNEPVVVVAPRVEVSGRVVGEEGFPLAGARVEIELPSDLRTRFRTVLDRSAAEGFAVATDEQGAFALADAPRIDGALLRASHDGYEPSAAPLEESAGTGITLVLARPRSEDGLLRGKVVDAAGAPVPGARVAFGVDVARSEDDGSFAFRIADPESLGARFHMPPTSLVAVKRGLLPARYEPPVVDGAPSWPSTVLLRLGETPLAIEGRVADHHGDPFPGAVVWIADATFLGASQRGPMQVENVLAGEDESIWRRIDADGEGRFRIDGLLPRDYRIRAMDPDTLLIAEDGPFAAGAVDVEIRLPTDELYPRVAGRVLSHAGTPIAGARIFPMCDAFRAKVEGRTISTSHEALDGTRTDEDGRFELENVPKSLVYLRVDGDEILPLEYGRYAEGDPRFENAPVKALPTDRIEDLEIVVDRRCHVQIELADPSSADEISILDAEGRPLVINVFMGNGRQENERAAIVDGRSFPMAVPDTGRTVVLYREGVEVLRTSIELEPGDLRQVRL